MALILAEVARVKVGNRTKFHKLRLSTIAKADIAPGRRAVPITIAEMAPPMIHDKYEGVATRRGSSGRTLIYPMADSDTRRDERTVIRLFELRNP